VADDQGLAIQPADDPVLVVRDLVDPLAGEHLGVLSGLGDRVGVVRPSRCHRDVTGLFEEGHPPVPARGQQPEPMNEDNGGRVGGVGTVDLCRFVVSHGRFGGRDGHLPLLVFGNSKTSETLCAG
jgi:hypothetical protein